MDLTSNKNVKIALLLLRLSMGWILIYAGLAKILNSDFTAAGFLKGAKTFPALFEWFASPANIGWVNWLNEWGVLALGVALAAGFLTKWISYLGILLMLLYYFPQLDFPKVGTNSYLVDDHVVYILLFVLFIVADAGKFWGLDAYLAKKNK